VRACRSVGSVPDEQPAERVAAAMQTLYAASPGEFMATRTRVVAESRAAGDSEAATAIGKLRKPSLAAWAVNLVARLAPEVVTELTDLGGRMRAAQARLETKTLTSLRPDRDRVVDGFVEAAARLVGGNGLPLSTAAQQDVRATAIAALADEEAAAAVASGQLTRALSYSGFGEVDLSDAVVRTSSGAILTVVRGAPAVARSGRRTSDSDESGEPGGAGALAESGPGERQAAEQDRTEQDRVAEAEAALAEAESALAAAEEVVTSARTRAEETRDRLAVVQRQLTKAREADERALEAVTDAVRTRKRAEATRHTAERALAEARGEA
jgi:hypothetical protein